MAPTKSRPQKTIEDYRALPDDVRAELVEGELLVTPAPLVPHQRVVGRVYTALDRWTRAGHRGEVFVAPLDVRLPHGDVVQPDVIWVAEANLGICRDSIEGVPDLLVEVVSPTHPERDRIVKRALYARNGVPAYWIVDPAERSVEVLRLAGGAYAPEAYFPGPEGVLRPSTPAGLALPLADLFGPA